MLAWQRRFRMLDGKPFWVKATHACLFASNVANYKYKLLMPDRSHCRNVAVDDSSPSV